VIAAPLFVNRIAEQVREAREAAGFVGIEGRRRVAFLAGYSEGYIRSIETNKSASPVVARKLARLYGCSLNLFYMVSAAPALRSR
jgi:transcriptional regulator with XRE-family HTH domain